MSVSDSRLNKILKWDDPLKDIEPNVESLAYELAAELKKAREEIKQLKEDGQCLHQ